MRRFSFGNYRPAGAPPPGGGILQPGVRYWGACGHIDQGGIYAAGSTSYANQAADLKDIFGSTPNTVIYRAFGDSRAHADIGTDVVAFQALDIIPLVLVCTYPDWGSFANEAAAYAWAYAETASVIANAPTTQLYEVGNEWNLQIGDAPGGNDGEDASDWTGIASYPLFRGAHAGAMQAIRDDAPDAQIIGGPTSGWVKTGFVKALADDIYTNYGGLVWDFTCNHWYRGESVNDFNFPDNVAGTGGNAYASMRPTNAAARKPMFFSEFGASVSGSTEATAASRTTSLMDNFYAQGVSDTGSELGCIGGCEYELYQHGVFATEYYLRYSADRSLSPIGTAVKNWIAANP